MSTSVYADDRNLSTSTSADAVNVPIRLNVITSHHGSVQKRMIAGPDGKPAKDPNHFQGVSRGASEDVTVPGLDGFADFLANLKPNQAIALGQTGLGRQRIVTDDKYKRFKGKWRNTITRSLSFYSWPDSGYFLLLLDHDPEPGKPDLTADQFWQAFRVVFPEFADAGRVVTVSTSSAIYDKVTGECLKPASGHHTYIVVKGDVERFKAIFQQRCWLHGLAFFKLGKPNEQTGVPAILERFYSDTSVLSPERLVYETGALIESGSDFEQRLPAPKVHDGGVIDLDAIPDLTDAEKRQAQANRDAARAKIEQEQLEKTTKAVQSQEPNLTPKRAKATASKRIQSADNGVLAADHILYLMDGSTITAGDITAQHNGVKLRDPQEPNYRGGAQVAKIYADDRGWVIVSQAHGGCKYRLEGSGKKTTFLIPESQKLTRVTQLRHKARLSDAMQDVDLNNAKLIGVKAPCGNGKTYWVSDYLKPYQDNYVPIYPITYRETLERGYGGKFHVPTRTEVEEYQDSIGITGQTFCIHSMRPDCKTQFDAATAEPGIVLLDEVRGILSDLTDSILVNRGKVIPQFVEFLQKCHAAGYPIIVMDANLTDAELNAIAAAIGIADDQIVTVKNTVKHWEGRPVYTAPAAALTIKLREHIGKQRGPVLCTTSSQKPGSRYGTISLERECRKAGLKRVLRVDQETKRDQNHPAAKLMMLLESEDFELARGFIQEWDAIILSPVIEAGFSLEVFGYFTAQFSFNQGNLPVENCIQQMLRLRDKNVPVYCSIPNNRRGMMSALRRGNGSDDPHVLSQGELMRAKGNLHQLLAPSSDGGSINTALLDYWFLAAARQNASIEHYQDLIEAYLTEMGHVVSSLEDCPGIDEQKAESQQLKQSAVADQVDRSLENADAEDIDDSKADELKQKAFISFDEQRAIEKHGLSKRYQCEVTPGLALLDALFPDFKGQTQLLFYLTLGRKHLKDKEQGSLNRLADDGAVFLPDLNKRLFGYRVHSLELLKIKALMDRAGDEISNDDDLIDEIGRLLEYCSTDVKRLMGINFDDRWGTIRRINHICRTWLGMPLLRRCKTKGRRGERRKVVYEVLPLDRPADELPARFEDAQIDPFNAEDLDGLTDAYRSFLLSHWLQNAELNAPCSASV